MSEAQERSIGLLGIFVISLVILGIIFSIYTVLKQKSLGPSKINSLLGVEFQEDMNGNPVALVVSNPTDEEVKEIEIVFYMGENNEKRFTISDVSIKPHDVEVINLKKRIDEYYLENSRLMEIYYKGKLVARRVMK